MKREYGTNGNNWERARLERMASIKARIVKAMRSRRARSQLFPFVPYSLFILIIAFPVFQEKKIIGRWDLTIEGSAGSYPSWLEVSNSGDLLTGRFVGRWGAVQPVKSIRFDGNLFEMTIDQKWENWPHDLVFKGKMEGGRLRGTTVWSGEEQDWAASQAP